MDCVLCQHELRGRQQWCLINGKRSCRLCQFRFAGLRGIAFAIDFALFGYLPYFIANKLSVALTAPHDPTGIGLELRELEPRIYGVVWLIIALIFFTKDGYAGFSPGKWLLGLRVLSLRDRTPIGPVESLKRNVLLLVPIVWPFVPFQVLGGSRGGDDLAHTRVIWLRYRHASCFLPRADRCVACGYSLRGNQSARCPECGGAV
ncbi:MAG: RDD family protein [Phycisphaerae bacterium]